MSDFISVISGIVVTVATSMTVYFLQRFVKNSDKKEEEREKKGAERREAQRRESMLLMEMQMATAKLALATAVALKRGHANGEVEEGVKAYEAAHAKYQKFIEEQAAQHIH